MPYNKPRVALPIFLNQINALPPPVIFCITFFIIIIAGYIDHITTKQVALSAFYIFPIALFSWNSKKRYVILVAALAALIRSDILFDKLFGTDTHYVIHLWNFSISLLLYIPVGLVIIEVKKAYMREKELARVDFVTGIANWKAFSESMMRENERCKRYNTPLSIVYIDCDNFKILNDTKGHTVGDDALKTVAVTIEDNIRTLDLVARLGGDEFAIILTNAGETQAMLVVKKLNKILLKKMKNKEYAITFSIGIATFTTPQSCSEEMIKLADELMYEVKKQSKNGINQKVF
jgi:diguanylate cyclase (GGDEF)-like protein